MTFPLLLSISINSETLPFFIENYHYSFTVFIYLTLYLGTEFIILNEKMNSVEHLTIGELAKRSRVNLQTIRYYERQGLLAKPPRSVSGYRVFSADSVRQIRFIKQAQKLGFSLKEVKELLALQNDSHSTGAEVRKRALAKIADIEEKMKTLRGMKKVLVRLTATCSGETSIGECPILERLSLEEE